MVIPTFERSLDLLLGNDFELTEEEIETLMSLLEREKGLIPKIDRLVQSIDPDEDQKCKLKESIKKVLNSHSDSVEQVFHQIINDKKVISFIQEVFLKRLVD